MTSGFDGATASAPTDDASFTESKTAYHVSPPLVVLPTPPARKARENRPRLRDPPARGGHATRAEWPDVAPGEAGEQLRRDRVGGGWRSERHDGEQKGRLGNH